MKSKWRRLGPPLLLYSADVTITLVGQPSTYWAGDRESAIEANPVGAILLHMGPWHFTIAAIVWAATFALILWFWRHWLANAMAYAIALGHAVGAASWFVRLGPWGTALAIGYVAGAAWFIRRCWAR